MPTLNVPQGNFLSLPHKFKAFVAGFGSGKTWVGGAGVCKHVWEHPKVNSGYFAPTYSQIRDIFYPTIEEVAHDWGLKVKVRQSNKEIDFYSGRQYRGTTLCRSMDKPSDIVGFRIGHALIDELDLMKIDKAETAWRKIIARMRYKVDGLKNGINVTTTPEGFKFVYRQFLKSVRDNPDLGDLYGLVQASTYDNERNLPDDYISSLFESYPPQLIDAYLNGQFVNMTSGSVYPCFDRSHNHTNEVMRDGEALHIGMDFNVNQMAAGINVIRDGLPLTVAELTDVRDTPTMASLLKDRYKDRSIVIYPDATGRGTSSKNASESDLSILKQAGFTVRVNRSNPAVRDRVLAVNSMLENAEGARRWKINTDQCPKLTEALEQQAYDKNGEPDKSSGLDHIIDGQGYFIAFKWPVTNNKIKLGKVTGL